MLKQKTLLFWGIIIAVIVAVFSLYYFSLDQGNVKLLPEKLTPTSSQPTTTSSIPPEALDLSAGAIANWAVCRNEEYGYEFKYPKGWYAYRFITGGEEGYPEVTSVCEGPYMVLSQYPTIRGGFIPLSVYIIVETVDVWERSLTQRKELNVKTGVKFNTDEKIVSGEKVKYYNEIGSSHATFFHDGKAFSFTVPEDTRGKKLSELDLSNDTPGQKLLDTMLSTFKFLN